MKKKLFTLLLVVSLVCGSLVGCGGGNGGKEGGGTKQNNPGAGETVDLVLWCSYAEASTAVLKQMIARFNEEYDQYNLTVENPGTVNQFRTKLATMRKEDYPSLFFGVVSAMAEYVDASYVQPLQPYLDADEDKWTDDMYDNVRTAYSDLEGNMIGSVMGLSAKGYLVNVTALNAAGYQLEDITSFEKLTEASKAAVEKGIVKYGYSCGDGSDIMDILAYQGVDILDGGNGYNGEVTKSMYTEGETKEALKKLLELEAELYRSGAANKNTSGTSAGLNLFVNNSLMFWTCTNSFVYEIADVSLDFEWAFLPHVGVDDNAKYKGKAMVQGTGIFIANTGNEAEMQGAYEFIKFLARPENQLFWATYRGYVPYTRAVAASEEWLKYQEEVFPSSVRLMEMMQNTSSDLRCPYSKVAKAIIDANSNLNSEIMTYPDGNHDDFIKEAAASINQTIETLRLRGN